MVLLGGLLIAFASLMAIPVRAAAATVSTCDEATLRTAIAAATPGDAVTFACSGTITLTAAGGGPIVLDKDLAIDASGQSVTISGGGSVGVIEIGTGVTVTLGHLTIADGADGDAGGFGIYGGILNRGTLNLDHSTVSGSTALAGTGGIRNWGTLNITASTITGNSGLVAGIHQVNGTLNVTDSTVSGNIGATTTVYQTAGAIVLSYGTATVTGSTLAGNRGDMAGGISIGLDTTLAVINSTLSGNVGQDWDGSAGAIRNDFGTLTVINTTIAGNGTPYCFYSSCSTGALNAGGIFNVYGAGIVTLQNTILADNLGLTENCFTNITDGGGNLSDDSSCGFSAGTSQNNVAGLSLNALADNGGPTQTIALGAGSAAIDAGSCVLSTDQRGLPRPGAGGPLCDSGAFEVHGDTVPAPQVITFTSTAPADAIYGDTYEVSASGGGSGNPVVFAIDASSITVCSIAGTTVSLTGTGICTVNANQAGDANYLAAAQVSQAFRVAQAPQLITFGALSDQTFGAPDFTVVASAGSGLVVTFSAAGDCTVSATTVHLAAAGTCTITANQAGDANYAPAPSVSQSFAIATADLTPPVLTATQTPLPNAHGWNSTDVTVGWACTDADSGVDLAVSELGTDVLTASGTAEAACTDLAGNTVNASHAVLIDKVAAVLTATQDPAPNGNGWNNTPVTVSYLCDDPLSGVANLDADETLSTEGANQSATGSCTDKAGNSATAAVSGISIDLTAPSISGSASPGANGNGWNNTPVTVSYLCADALSGVAWVDSDDVLSTEGENQSATGSCTDSAGNSATATVSDISIDLTEPDASTSQLLAASASGWENTTVTVSFTCVDDLSGIDDPYPVPVVLDQEGAAQVAAGTCYDRAGNASIASLLINIDTTAPAIAVASPLPWSVNLLGFAISFTATDSPSGVESVVATLDDGVTAIAVGDGYLVNAPGAYRLSVVATDKAGNVATEVVDFVVYDPAGGSVSGGGKFSSPSGALASDPGFAGSAFFTFHSSYKKGATVPAGTTSFWLQTNLFRFVSGSYEWLVVNQGGTNAQFKGTGTIDGSPAPDGGRYRFMVWATDGRASATRPGTFRIKIWHEGDGFEVVVYDNGVEQPIEQGSITIQAR